MLTDLSASSSTPQPAQRARHSPPKTKRRELNILKGEVGRLQDVVCDLSSQMATVGVQLQQCQAQQMQLTRECAQWKDMAVTQTSLYQGECQMTANLKGQVSLLKKENQELAGTNRQLHAKMAQLRNTVTLSSEEFSILKGHTESWVSYCIGYTFCAELSDLVSRVVKVKDTSIQLTTKELATLAHHRDIGISRGAGNSFYPELSAIVRRMAAAPGGIIFLPEDR